MDDDDEYEPAQENWAVQATCGLMVVSHVLVRAPSADQAVELLKEILGSEEDERHEDALNAVKHNNNGYEPLDPHNVDFEEVDDCGDPPDHHDWPN